MRSLGLLIAFPVLVALQADLRPGTTKTNPKDAQTYVWIPPGSFTMGCSPDDTDCTNAEKPAHTVAISKGFWMAQTPTTVATYTRFSQMTGTALPPSRDSRGRKQNAEAEDPTVPVVGITWEEARSFCEWAMMRLPTEAEWEYAARAATTGARYGNIDDIAWYGDNSGRQRIDSAAVWRDSQTAGDVLYANGNEAKPVAHKRANAWDLHDMLGNVTEWTADVYRPYEGEAPTGSSTEQRAVRGGPFTQPARLIRVSRRFGLQPAQRNSVNGFRCVGD